MRHNLSKVITARYIRFQPTDWHEQISMRVELYGCYGKVSPQLLHNFKLIVSKYIISTSSSGGRGGGEGTGGGVKKSFSALLRASVWSKNNLRRVGGGGGGAAPRDPPLSSDPNFH